MTTDELIMQRCLQLARMGAGFVSPNPMVGCVIDAMAKLLAKVIISNMDRNMPKLMPLKA